MTFAVVEDDKQNAEVLVAYLKRYCQEHSRSVKIEAYSSGDEFLSQFKSGKFSIIFMDIEMPGPDGMSVAHKLRNIDKKALIFFVTNLAQYAVQGYEVQAFDFIIKPVQYFNFAMKLNRAFECLNNMVSREIWVSSRQGKKCVNAEQIKYVEIMGHTLIFHTVNESITVTGTLKSVTSDLEGLPFSLCNRCYLVNLRFVTEVKEEVVTVGGDELKISAPKRKTFLSELNNYIATGGSR